MILAHGLWGRPQRTFAYTATNLNETYSPPVVDGVPNPSTAYEYDPDHLLKKVTRPDGGVVDLAYATATGQLTHAEFPSAGSSTPRWQVDYSYWNGVPAGNNPGGGLLRKADRVGMATVEYRYDGSLPTQEQWTGRVQGTLGRTYDTFFRPATDVVSAGSTSRAVSYKYDDDGLLTSIGASDSSWSYVLHRNHDTGMLDSTHVAPSSAVVAVTTSADYDLYGDLANLRYAVNGAELFQQSIHHDERGRVDVISERWSGGTPKVTSYGYDAAGRLATVTVDGALDREYGYDPNGNRNGVSVPLPGGGFVLEAGGVYDEQDRLLSYGEGAFPAPNGMTWLSGGPPLTTYGHTANGERTTKAVSGGGATTRTTYDAMGALVGARVWTEDGPSDSVTFALDGQHRRVAAYRNGVFERGWLYEGISVVAELSDSITLAHRYVYGSRDHVPDLMWDADSAIAYRLVTDHLGSVRAVVRLTDGAIVQRTDYDAWGEVTAESNPELLSLGFAGGLRERTTGLVRFGARDYDATVGRWTGKDRHSFLDYGAYAYASDDPVSRTDATGLVDRPALRPNGSVDGRILALLRLNSCTGRKIGGSMRGLYGLIEKLQYFYDMERTGGPLDMKNNNRGDGLTGSEAEAFGNVNYGVLARAVGINDVVALLAAGGVDIKRTLQSGDLAQLLERSIYGDDVEDSEYIELGMALHEYYLAPREGKACGCGR